MFLKCKQIRSGYSVIYAGICVKSRSVITQLGTLISLILQTSSTWFLTVSDILILPSVGEWLQDKQSWQGIISNGVWYYSGLVKQLIIIFLVSFLSGWVSTPQLVLVYQKAVSIAPKSLIAYSTQTVSIAPKSLIAYSTQTVSIAPK